MPSSNPDIALFEEVAAQDPSLNWFAIADSAQHRDLPGAILQRGFQARCLLGAAPGSPVSKHAPHLVELRPPQQGGTPWHWISLNASSRPCVSIIATVMPFEALFAQLSEITEVILPDEEVMFFGFWDPAILGTLVGQADDLTLHVAGPVLNQVQLETLLHEIHGWWYWDRDGKQCAISPVMNPHPRPAVRFRLNQQQVDDLVEASVPDHVLYYLELNQPLLLEPIQKKARYQLVRKGLVEARTVGLLKMDELVNYVCLTLIYGARFQEDKIIRELLDRVSRGQLSFASALESMP